MLTPVHWAPRLDLLKGESMESGRELVGILVESKIIRAHTICSVLTVILIITSLGAYAGTGDSDSISASPDLITFLRGESAIVEAPWPVIRVAVTDPTVADVQVLTADRVLLQGLKTGSTDLIVWSEDEAHVKRWKVQVMLDTASLKAKLDTLFPDAEL